MKKQYIQIHHQFFRIILDLLKLRKKLPDNSIILIMSPSHKLTFFAKIITIRPVCLDAGWPLTDGILSRGTSIRTINKLIKSYLVDFLAFHSADLVLVESGIQLQRVSRYYLLRKRKLATSFTGLNESGFSRKNEPSLKVLNLMTRVQELDLPQTVLFRGKINKESGINLILEAASMLQQEAVFIFLVGKSDTLILKSLNCIVISDVSNDELKDIYSFVDLALGQLSSHGRLRYTIPHKAFEAGYFAKPYISADSPGIREIFSSDSIILLGEISVDSLVFAIRSLQSKNEIDVKSQLIQKQYAKYLSQSVINAKFKEIVLYFFFSKSS